MDKLLDQIVDTEIDAAIEEKHRAENSAVISAEDTEEAIVPYCCAECEGIETLYATVRSVFRP